MLFYFFAEGSRCRDSFAPVIIIVRQVNVPLILQREPINMLSTRGAECLDYLMFSRDQSRGNEVKNRSP